LPKIIINGIVKDWGNCVGQKWVKAMSDRGLSGDYESAGFGGSLAFGKRPALILVDPVLAYVDPACQLFAGESALAALDSMARLRDAFHQAGMPVVMTGVSYLKGGVDGGLFFKKVPALKLFEQGGSMGAFPNVLTPTPDDILVFKNYASAFFATSLASTLHALKVDCVMIGGYSTSGCVRATTLDALQSGFAPFVIADACADRDPRPHEANLFDLQAKYAEVIDEAAALELITSLPLD
jgi:maleamate amidohydrolase